MATAKKETPLMKQYNAIKVKHPDALLLFRVGDFYETFGADAVKASKILDIVLTKRANGSASHIELAGFPHHSLDTYLPKLVRAGNRVAICDQLEDPKSVKGIVKRGVTELVTPGLTLNDNVLDQKKNNYLASVAFGKDIHGIAFLDLSTGEFMVSTGDLSYIDKMIQGFSPSEVIYCKKNREQFTNQFGEDFNTFCLEEWIYGFDFGYEKLNTHFKTKNLKGFGIEDSKEGICAAGAILFYLEETEHKEISHISAISRIDTDKYVWLDKFTIRNLELVYAQQSDGVPLLHVMDDTQTPMGARLLKKWMVLPLKEKAEIEARLNVVEALIDDPETSEQVLSHLQQIGDVERLVSKVAALRINPRELLHLKKALKNIAPIKAILESTPNEHFKKFGDKLNPCTQLIEKIDLNLKEELPLNATQGNIIQDGIDTELDELRKIAFSGKDYLLQIQEREKERTGISSLKIAYNRVFGYYLEVSNAHKDKVPQEWIRKQTLVNAERYITEELKTYEEKILTAEDKLSSIELRLFNELVTFTADYVAEIQNNARNIAQIDCLLSFGQVAIKQNYCRPSINNERAIDIKEGRHPVIETQLPTGEEYISNSVFLDDISQQIMIITGPNMAGKSALLRQTALIVLMAQMGAYVPAAYAKIGIIDKVFTRVGASDNLSKGESTFMVEMTETASILNNLSENSLVLMDEIGRGTSTYDGVSIAWSIVEHLHNHPKCHAKTMFATHYHELNQIAEDFPRVKNFNVSVKELDNRVIFMRKLKEGGSQHSFGIHVAQMAGMPNGVVIRANEILQHLEKDKIKEQHDEKIESLPKNNFQLSMFESDPHFEEVLGLLNRLDVNTISPVEALLKLNEIKTILKGKK
ncbi:DNA mismatch repair protein MutS [Reichenbachiella carrageenanivorans]|uniref:DNA mismatch repair protein MutS n=2 Tax=Reichenbachiella carrageenanivorans TaxID=2979869 RepID=A0ABY6D1T5_9BACT|nr:DNA mismatch repair protein MutS [Reichenbachiella carrageenanivorans]UXX80129.1 DNA mismatch repair protein MutS [Reichenbachiella carrageenanivorans]